MQGTFRIPTLISTTTCTGATTFAITSGIDSTYDEYIFLLTDIHPANDGANIQWNVSDDTSSHSYDLQKHSAAWDAENDEGAGDGAVDTAGQTDLTNDTGVQILAYSLGNDADQSCAGVLQIYRPADTTYYKRYTSTINLMQSGNEAETIWVSGHIMTTAAVTAIQFSSHSGNIDSGKIRMFGIS